MLVVYGEVTDIIFNCKLQYFFESVDRILSTNGITFKVTNVVICRQQYTDRILSDLEM
jgi:hypothetical protein